MKTTNESTLISDEVTVHMEIDRHEGEYLDTRVIIDGEFWVSGEQRKEFTIKLGELIDQYRI